MGKNIKFIIFCGYSINARHLQIEGLDAGYHELARYAQLW